MITLAPHHEIWQRCRRLHHGGAVRAYAKPPSPQYGRSSPAYCEHCTRVSPSGRGDRGREIEWDEGEVTIREHQRKPDLLDELDFSTEVAGSMLHNIPHVYEMYVRCIHYRSHVHVQLYTTFIHVHVCIYSLPLVSWTTSISVCILSTGTEQFNHLTSAYCVHGHWGPHTMCNFNILLQNKLYTCRTVNHLLTHFPIWPLNPLLPPMKAYSCMDNRTSKNIASGTRVFLPQT